jgi:hypothetical protein
LGYDPTSFWEQKIEWGFHDALQWATCFYPMPTLLMVVNSRTAGTSTTSTTVCVFPPTYPHFWTHNVQLHARSQFLRISKSFCQHPITASRNCHSRAGSNGWYQ